MKIPTDEQIRALHLQVAPTPEAFHLVFTHCEIVCEVAEQLISAHTVGGHQVDVDLVRAGCLLHDIGVYRLYDEAGQLDVKNYIRHGLLGYDLLSELGFPDVLCRFCSHHTGVGLTRDDIVSQNLPLPVGDYLAETAEEVLVMYADKFHSKTTPPVFVTAAAYAKGVSRFGAGKAAQFASLVERFGEPDLRPLANRYRHSMV